MRRLLDFIALDRISFQVLPHQNLWGRNPNQALAPVVLSLKHNTYMHLPHAPGNPCHRCECGRSQAGWGGFQGCGEKGFLWRKVWIYIYLYIYIYYVDQGPCSLGTWDTPYLYSILFSLIGKHHVGPASLFAIFFFMFENLCGGDPFQSQKVSQTNTITKRVLKGKVMRRLLDFIALDRMSLGKKF